MCINNLLSVFSEFLELSVSYINWGEKKTTNNSVYTTEDSDKWLNATEAFPRLSTLRILRTRSSCFLSLFFWQQRPTNSKSFFFFFLKVNCFLMLKFVVFLVQGCSRNVLKLPSTLQIKTTLLQFVHLYSHANSHHRKSPLANSWEQQQRPSQLSSL